MEAPECPYCHNSAVLVDSVAIYGARDRNYGKMWWCQPCDAYVGVHKNSRHYAPLGRLANKELRRWKQNAHFVFDPLWQNKQMTRTQAYQKLAKLMNIPEEDAHIGKFDVEQCKRLVSLLCPKIKE